MSSSSDTGFNEAAAKSTSTFLAALYVAGAVAGVECIVFVALRPTIKKLYAPRTYLPVPSRRTATPSFAPWGFVKPVFTTPSREIIAKNGLDAYMYLRFLKMMIFIFGPTMLFTWAVLLPVNAVGTSVSSAGLDAFSFGNIPTTHQSRYWAHLICAYVMCFWVFFLLYREASSFVELRQEYLLSHHHLSGPQARTVLVTGVPREYLERDAILRLTSRLPGGVRQMWISRALADLPNIYDLRLNATKKLESAETALCKTAIKLKAAADKKQAKEQRKRVSSPTAADTSLIDRNADQAVPTDKRPHHRLGFMGLFGQRVDTIDHCKKEIVNLTKQLTAHRARVDEHPPQNSVFIEFEEQMAAHLFAQAVVHHVPLQMANKYVDVAPDDIIYSNLNVSPYDLRVRNGVVWVITIVLIVLWSFPVAFIGVVSNLSSLCSQVSWLAWMCRLPKRAQAIIQGVLPPLLLMLLFLVLPIIFRLLGRYSGIPRRSAVELSLMSRYYPFLVVHGFLVTTLASGLTAAIPEITANPGDAVTILTQRLPAAAIFFMTYIVTNMLTNSAGALLSVLDLLIYYIKVGLSSSTPRSIFGVRYQMNHPDWGTLFPNTTLLVTISFSYAIIAPIMSGLALLGFSLFWFARKHQFLFVADFPTAHETGGLFFVKALSHVFIGLYIMQLCLAGLFFIARNSDGHASSIPQGGLMILLIVITIFYHRMVYSTYSPLAVYLPLDLDEKRENEGLEGEDLRRQRHQAKATGEKKTDAVEMEELGEGEKRRSSGWAKERSMSPPRTNGGGVRKSSAKSVEQRQERIGEEDEEVDRPGRFAFTHPAIWEPTRPVWVPDDPLGVGKAEVAALQKLGIPASTAGAGMNAKGQVFVTRSPPENVEIIELAERDDRGGLFAVPGAIGAGAIKAVKKVGAETRDLKLDERLRRTRREDGNRRLGLGGMKPPRVSLSRAANRRRRPSVSAESENATASETDVEPRSRNDSEYQLASSSSPEVDVPGRPESAAVTAGVALPGQSDE